MTTPKEHLDEAQKLTVDALVDLFEITLTGTESPTMLCLTNGESLTWQGRQYEGKACKISTVARNADGERPRPTLTVFNPVGVYNPFVFAGYFDRAQVVRRRVLGQHLLQNVNLSDNSFWFINRVREMISNQSVAFELRAPSDGPSMQIPARMFIPPAFPFVTF